MASFSEIIALKYEAITEAKDVYLTVNNNLNNWYTIRYVNTSNNTVKDYYMFVTGVAPKMWGNKVYDFDILCRGYICVVKDINSGDFISLDASTDTMFKKVLTQGTSDPNDDPSFLSAVDRTVVDSDLGTMIHRFVHIS